MIGIKTVATYLPPIRRDNRDRLAVHGVEEAFLEQKIGFMQVARAATTMPVAELCAGALERLKELLPEFDLSSVDLLAVCTQTPDAPIPHAAAVLHGELGLDEHCATFDISHGCAGYPYLLTMCRAFMQEQGLRTGLLFTCDPYSSIIDEQDRNTDLLFGDGATVTLMGENPAFALGTAAFTTVGSMQQALSKPHDAPLSMNGREIFNFVLRKAPDNIRRCLSQNGLTQDDVDLFLLHQASRYVLDNLTSRMGVPKEKAPFAAGRYGNTISSSIPFLLAEADEKAHTLLLSGFGVGLCAASLVLQRVSR
jgi:3-oxoacyl-[acyl-carrier-protein] synthase III